MVSLASVAPKRNLVNFHSRGKGVRGKGKPFLGKRIRVNGMKWDEIRVNGMKWDENYENIE